MSRINVANLKKTIYYLKRNGLRDTYLAALERLQEKDKAPWVYTPVSAAEEQSQREKKWAEGFACKFSIVVPTYKTPAQFLRAMIESCLEQTYSDFELILADASGDGTLDEENVKSVVATYSDPRIKYIALESNDGISANTNQGLRAVTGDYIGLLDHDDVLTKDALYEMALEIEKAYVENRSVKILYSDEDKCDETGRNFYEPHLKTEFNLDLILSNNYFCHFLVMKSELMKAVGFRREFDGAQDFDIVLQSIAKLMEEENWKTTVIHVPKVLYHWRCHSGSTAVNPASKMYAYEAGGRAITSFLEKVNWKAQVEPLKHLGFYRVNYEPDVFAVRSEVGVVGGPVYGKGNKITGGMYNKDGEAPYNGLRKGFSGYMHRAVLQQEVYAADIRNVKVRKELQPLYEEIMNIPDLAPDKRSLLFAERVRDKGYMILWDPKVR